MVATFEWFDKNTTAINVHHDHDVFVASLQGCGKFACLIGENCFASIIYTHGHILYLLSLEGRGVGRFEWRCFRLGGSYIFACLIHVALVHFVGFGVVLSDVVFCEEWPPDKITCFDCFEPCRFYGVSAHCVHPLDGLFNGRQVVYIVGLL